MTQPVPKSNIERRSLQSVPTRRFTYPTQAVFLSQAALLEEVGPPKIPAFVCLLGCALVCIAVATAILVKVDVISSSTGRIVPSEANQGLQSFDGGLVQDIHVKEGQIVEAGDLLLTLRDPEAEAQLRRLQARQTSLAAQSKRLRLLTGLKASEKPIMWPNTAVFDNQQMAILPLEEAAIASERSLVRAEIRRNAKALANLLDVRDNVTSKLKLAQEKLATQTTLYDKKLLPKSALFETEREASDNQLDLTEIEGRIIETESTMFQLRQQLEDVIASRRERQGNQLSSIMVDLSELQQQIAATRERIERTIFTAPIRAVIHELNADFTGQIIAPGEKLLELIPMDTDLIVDARLPTSEIRHVKLGQDVRLSVDGVEPHRTGYLEGTVRHLSPSTFLDEQGQPYYRARINLVSNDLAGTRLTPGMTVQAQIKTDQRTILEYLLKPVYRAWDTAFRER